MRNLTAIATAARRTAGITGSTGRVIGHMSRLLQLLIVTALLTPSLAAQATADGGTTLRLLGVAGPNERFAILAEEEVQGDCADMGCKVFAVEVAAGSRKRLHEHRLAPVRLPPSGIAPPNASKPLARYLNNLDESARRHLSPVRSASKAPKLVPDALLPKLDLEGKDSHMFHKSFDALRFTLPGKKQGLKVTLQHSTPFPSAAISDRLNKSADDMRWCIDHRTSTAMCSSCKQITLQVNGAPQKVWSCPGVGRYRGAAKGTEPCDCSAKGRITTLKLRHTTSGRQWLGTSTVAEPGAFHHNGPHNGHDISLDFGIPQVTSDLHAVQLRSGLLVFGSIANARAGNGTFVPVFVTAPQLAEKKRPSLTLDPSPTALGALTPHPGAAAAPQLARVAWSCLFGHPAHAAALVW